MANVRYLACAQIQFNTKENIDHLKYTNEILKYLRRQNRHLMGISTFNRVEMHRRWQDYCRTAPKIEYENMTYFLVRVLFFIISVYVIFFIYREVILRIFMIQLILTILIR